MEIAFDIGSNATPSGKIVDAIGEIDLAQIGSAYVRPLETSKGCGSSAADDPAYLRAVTAYVISCVDGSVLCDGCESPGSHGGEQFQAISAPADCRLWLRRAGHADND
jgi:hypothetical protein